MSKIYRHSTIDPEEIIKKLEELIYILQVKNRVLEDLYNAEKRTNTSSG